MAAPTPAAPTPVASNSARPAWPGGPVHVLAASSRCGLALCRRLLADGVPIHPVVRTPARWHAAMPGVPARQADLGDGEALAAVLADATIVVSTAHAAFTGAVLAAAPPEARLILMGSTRRFTRWPDEAARLVLEGEAAFAGSGRHGVMLHPTMIYGPPGAAEDNIHRLARLLRRLSVGGRPLAPLPGAGRALVQPIFLDDVAAALHAALTHPWECGETLVIAGPAPVPYAEFVCAVAAATGLGRPLVLPVPLRLAHGLASRLPRLAGIGADALRRLGEDRAFDITPARRRLGFAPVPLTEGLRRSFPSPA